MSLKEPTGLHEWDWLGVPRRCLRYLLHKLVLEVRRPASLLIRTGDGMYGHDLPA